MNQGWFLAVLHLIAAADLDHTSNSRSDSLWWAFIHSSATPEISF